MDMQTIITNVSYQINIEECMVAIQNNVESSFKNIEAYIDSLFNQTSDSLNIDIQKSLNTSSCGSSICCTQTKFVNVCFAQQLYQDISPYIATKIKSQLLFKDESLNQKNQQIVKDLQQDISEKSQTVKSFHQQNFKPFNYQLIQEYSISQNESCLAIAINKDCSTLVAGSESQIKVFEFKQGVMKLFQCLCEHQKKVVTLNFMKKSNQFISGSYDNQIKIWQREQNNQWKSQQTLNGHINYIYCQLLNDNEDLIISGSYDGSIKFWTKKKEWLCSQTITNHSGSVYGLCLNQQQNKVVSCGSDKLILIIEQSEFNKEWIVIQKIKDDQGCRVCFCDNNKFIFSLFKKELISIFELKNQFNKTKQISVKCGSDGWSFFPQQLINSKSIIVSKNGEYVNLIRKKQDGDLLTEQSIHFGTNTLFGTMSDDGEYLITWDGKSQQIQVRIFQEK
ncbi:unnamed protein product [Paramecium octaurelia]|uniref:WD domain, G-beta repeat protein n=1 Tax=Paramecium octaurelia TaxID=43137 RepID=A0A8S1WID4_PAROT|nr:unnamed protein product [Paramecium octaurelia]